jgi:hypothetical protein
MMRVVLLVLLSASFLTTLPAQDSGSWPLPCGSPPGKSEWLKKYQQNPQAHHRSLDSIIYAPLAIHLLGDDNGNGYFPFNNLLNALCKLNEDFAATKIVFYLEGPVRYIDRSDWRSHNSVLIGAEMMFDQNVENAINTYFVSNAAGNCGYNLPYAGIAMAVSCSGPTSSTWAHEIGHNLSVQHPFLGWEGGVSHDGSVSHNFNDPAPPIVTYDYTLFKDTLILDTLIIDTALVELVDGSNCHLAGDGFCDTSPDYLAMRWSCNSNAQSPIEQTDPAGVKFRSDGTLIMGYANDVCQSRFTPEQIGAMRANLFEEKASYLHNQQAGPPLSTIPPTLLLPTMDEQVHFEQAQLSWTPVENATGYLVQVSLLSSFSALTTEYLTTSPELLLNGLLNNRTYYWRVRAYNDYAFCAAASAAASFRTAQLTGLNSIAGLSGLSLSPTPTPAGSPAVLEFESARAFPAHLQLFMPTGQLILSLPAAVQTGLNRLEVATAALPPGMYFLRLQGPAGQLVERMVVGN